MMPIAPSGISDRGSLMMSNSAARSLQVPDVKDEWCSSGRFRDSDDDDCGPSKERSETVYGKNPISAAERKYGRRKGDDQTSGRKGFRVLSKFPDANGFCGGLAKCFKINNRIFHPQILWVK